MILITIVIWLPVSVDLFPFASPDVRSCKVISFWCRLERNHAHFVEVRLTIIDSYIHFLDTVSAGTFDSLQAFVPGFFSMVPSGMSKANSL